MLKDINCMIYSNIITQDFYGLLMAFLFIYCGTFHNKLSTVLQRKVTNL